MRWKYNSKYFQNIEKIAYLVPAVLDDVKDDLYEDVELTNEQYKKLKDLYDDVDTIHRYTDNTYYLELETLCRQALEFFNELEIDSEEIMQYYIFGIINIYNNKFYEKRQ